MSSTFGTTTGRWVQHPLKYFLTTIQQAGSFLFNCQIFYIREEIRPWNHSVKTNKFLMVQTSMETIVCVSRGLRDQVCASCLSAGAARWPSEQPIMDQISSAVKWLKANAELFLEMTTRHQMAPINWTITIHLINLLQWSISRNGNPSTAFNRSSTGFLHQCWSCSQGETDPTELADRISQGESTDSLIASWEARVPSRKLASLDNIETNSLLGIPATRWLQDRSFLHLITSKNDI